MQTRTNSRGFTEHYVTGAHLALDDLGGAARESDIPNNYLYKENVPAYPQPVFHVTQLKHDTGPVGLSGIIQDNGFRNPKGGSLLWWGLPVGPEEIVSAERRLLDEKYPDRTEEQIQRQENFLSQFATSPAFQSSSKLGSFRFTLPLTEVLGAYKEQFCDGTEPAMRVMKTILYKQEVVYVVLVHSPANNKKFSQYPLLTNNPDSICSYNNGGDDGDGHFTWRSQAMCETHRLIWDKDDDEKQMRASDAGNYEFYVWDNVAVALHVDDQVLTFERDQLKESLNHCEDGYPLIGSQDCFVSHEKAQPYVREKFDDPNFELQKA